MKERSVWIVEDEGLIALHLAELLENRGYHITGMFCAGTDVLQSLGQEPCPDLILMDIGLNGPLDGLETSRRIRQRFSLPIIFITAYTTESIRRQVGEIGSAAFIGKPFQEADVLSCIQDLLAREERVPE